MRAGADGSLWRAVDETLDRPVSVRVVRPGHRYTADVVDAARRAALVEDGRLVRVLDVGEAGGSAFIVSEHLVGRTLAELLTAGPVAPDIARRLVGEAAEALHRASARGLHHLRLNTESLVVATDGTVKVLGTAVEAALAGVDHHEDPIGAERTDAVGLVRLLYAGLTGRWPGVDGPLGTAPRVTGRVLPPGDVVPGVPNDLDTLCAVTLGLHDDGPQSPGDLARQLAPWGPAGPLTSRRGLPIGAAAGTRPPSAPATPPSAPATPPSSPGSTPDPTPVTPAAPAARSAARAAAQAAVPAGTGARPAAALPTLTPPTGNDTAVNGRAHGSTAAPTAPAADAVRAEAADDWALLSRPTPVAARPAAPQSEPLGPFIPPAPISRPPRDQARLVLSLVAGLVVLGLVLAIFSLRGLFGAAKPLVQPAPIIPPSATVTGTGSAPAAPPPSAAQATADGSSSSAATGAAAEISGIQAIDPQGDGDENGSTADKAIDGDTSSTWRSARYNSAAFGGLKKGLGLYLQLSSGPLTSVTVDMSGTGGTVELRTANGPGLEESVVVASAQAQGGKAVLTPTTPLTGGPLILWFTSLPQQDNGEYRLVVSEITAS